MSVFYGLHLTVLRDRTNFVLQSAAALVLENIRYTL